MPEGGYDRGPEIYDYEGYQPGSVLAQIRVIDPDGGERQPTAADYAAFKDRVIREIGQDSWDAYRGGTDREPG
jgi:hypothetical protein